MAYSHSPGTPVTVRWSSTVTYPPSAKPTDASPMPVLLGRRPAATTISSATMTWPLFRVTVTSPPCGTPTPASFTCGRETR